MTKIKERMTPDPVVLDAESTIADAARRMRDQDIGDVLVSLEGGYGIVTDRDIAVRSVAAGWDPEERTVGDIATTELDIVSPDDDLGEVVERMREDKIRRVPVCEGDEIVGILSIGDLAVMKDKDSALADISAAPGNN